MRFVKMHGAGNDYVYVDCFDQPAPADPAALAPVVSDRHTGVGGDGLVLILPSDLGDARMRMFNNDGSEAEMCGNAIRCVAKYLWDRNIARRDVLDIETASGVRRLQVFTGDDGRVARVRVDMGEPRLRAEDIPTTLAVDAEGRVVDQALDVLGEQFCVTCVSMGNPHAILYVDDVAALDLARLGPAVECHAAFPRRVNVHFVSVRSRGEADVRTWERGSGPTLACGTGASAVCVAGVLTDRTDRALLAHLPGGDLELQWTTEGPVLMTGPAVEVFTGEWPD